MKPFITFINESNHSDILDILKTTEFDFGNAVFVYGMNDEEMKEVAKKQEQIIVDTLKSVMIHMGYDILTCKEWCKENKLNWSPKVDSFYGDIMITEGDKTIFNIDVKSGTKGTDYYGTPTALSLSNFGMQTAVSSKFIYMCCKWDGSSAVLVDRNKLFNAYKNDRKAYFIASYNREKELRDDIFSNAYVKLPKNMTNTEEQENFDPEVIFEKDFVPTSVITRKELSL